MKIMSNFHYWDILWHIPWYNQHEWLYKGDFHNMQRTEFGCHTIFPLALVQDLKDTDSLSTVHRIDFEDKKIFAQHIWKG